ncbi:MAG: hypothetical protein H6Q67_1849 [Firmicutes bacterium]|nr:hypothetical protein [Bacillota bacterium]
MRKDVFLQSVYAGMLSSIVYTLVELFLIRIGFLHTSVWNAAAGMFLPINQVTTQLGTLIGLITHIGIGGLWGIGFYILLLFFGVNKSALKGVLFGLYLWIFGAIMMHWGVTSYVYFDLNEQVGAFLGTLVFGLSLGFLVPRLTMQGISEQNSVGLFAKMTAQPAYKPFQDNDDNNI